jgi:hypothetical protein
MTHITRLLECATTTHAPNLSNAHIIGSIIEFDAESLDVARKRGLIV